MTRLRRLASSTVLGLVGTSLALVSAASPAHAAEPVVGDDEVSMYPGNVTEVDVLANDSDADGDELQACRLGDESYKKVSIALVNSSGGDDDALPPVLALSLPNAKPGTYTFTYYACDFDTLVPGTISVTIKRPPKITAVALPGQPGRIKVKNPADFKISFLYGSFGEDEPEDVVNIPRNSSVVLRVTHTNIFWIAFSARRFEFLRMGRIHGIKLHRHLTPPRVGGFSPRVLKAWRDRL